MSAESELRDLFASSPSPEVRIDTAQVLRSSSRRRVARQATAGGVTTLAVAAIGLGGVFGIRAFSPQSSTSSAGGAPSVAESSGRSDGRADGGSTDRPDQGRATAEKINLCGAELAEAAPAASGLVLTPHFPATASAAATSVKGTVTLTNTGTRTITGTTAATPAVTLSQDGVTVWHTNGPTIMIAALVELAPGASMDYQATFAPVRCSSEDELAPSFPDDLPHVAPGVYQLSAAIDLTSRSAGDTVTTELVTGPVATISLR